MAATNRTKNGSDHSADEHLTAEFSIQQPVKTAGWTAHLIFCNSVVILGSSFMFGYNLAVVNGPYRIMKQFLNESFINSGQELSEDDLSTHWSLTVTLYLIGGVVGSTWFPGVLVSAIGKRKSLVIGAIVGALGEMVIFIGPYTGSYIPFMVGRSIVGFHGGLSMVIAPGLISEHAPTQLRGACGTLFSMGVAIGLLVANFLGLSFILGTKDLWPFLFLVVAAFYVLDGFGLYFTVESPRWLIDRSMSPQAIKALMKLRSCDDVAVRAEFDEIRRLAEAESKVKAVSLKGLFHDRRIWWPMIITINLHIANEMTGLSAVLIYATLVLSDSGLDDETAAIANFGLGFGLVVGALLCGLLVERIGRRWLMIAGTFSLVLINAFLVIMLNFNIFEGCIVGFALFLICFNSGPGSIPWIVPAEMFTQAARPHALAVGMFTNWVGNIIVAFVFPILQTAIGPFSFLPFAVIAGFEFLFFLFFLPETASKLANYSPDIFASGKSLVQLGKRRSPPTLENL